MDRFDVDDAELREDFLARTVPTAIARLGDAVVPQWGRMSPRQMIEHLLWAVELSTGTASVTCDVPEDDAHRARQFLYTNRPTPREYMNPALRNGLPPLRFGMLQEAKEALASELERFLRDPDVRRQPHTHPVFGALGHDEWHRVHYKHFDHHLRQFRLLGAPPNAA